MEENTSSGSPSSSRRGTETDLSNGMVTSSRKMMAALAPVGRRMSGALSSFAAFLNKKVQEQDEDDEVQARPIGTLARVTSRRFSTFQVDEDVPVEHALRIIQNLIEKQVDKSLIEDLRFVQRVLREDRGATVVPTCLTTSGFSLENTGIVTQWLNQSFARTASSQENKDDLNRDISPQLHSADDFPCHIPLENRSELLELLEDVDNWNFDLPKLDEISGHKALQVVTWHIFRKHGFFAKFDLVESKFKAFLHEVTSRYHHNPYHNALHAADVVQTTHALLCLGLKFYLTDIMCFAMLLSAVVHDIEHNARNNLFHVATQSEYALLHNDISVLENHHCCVCFSLLTTPAFAFTEKLSPQNAILLRQMIVPMILGTDMTYHFEHVSAMKSIIGQNGFELDKWSVDDLAKLRRFALHSADISNPTKPLPIAKQWTERCLNEFWQQGDEEKRLNLKVSPLCDRDTCSVPDSQIGFIKFVVAPTFDVLEMLLPNDEMSAVITQLATNLSYWDSLKREMELEKLGENTADENEKEQEKDTSDTEHDVHADADEKQEGS